MAEEEAELPACNVTDVVPPDESLEEVDCVGMGGRSRGFKLTHMDTIAEFPSVRVVRLRQSLIRKIRGVGGLARLTSLELYDNRVKRIEGLEPVAGTLTNLDISFNRIRTLEGLGALVNLTSLYVANNRLTEIPEGSLDALTSLRKLDLGSNKIKELAGVSRCVALRELWLGRNHISTLSAAQLAPLTALRILDVQSNRVARMEGFDTLVALEELYLGHNKISRIEGLAATVVLNTLDVSANAIVRVVLQDVAEAEAAAEAEAGGGAEGDAGAGGGAGAERGIEAESGGASSSGSTATAVAEAPVAPCLLPGGLPALKELWLNDNPIASFDSVETLAFVAPLLDVLYLERSPLQRAEPLYRKRIKELIPTLTQIDAEECY